MYHKPVCVKCNIELMPEKNGVTVVDYFMKNEQIYQLWDADLWKCPKCGVEIVVGFGQSPYAFHGDGNCERIVLDARRCGIQIVDNFETVPVHHETINKRGGLK